MDFSNIFDRIEPNDSRKLIEGPANLTYGEVRKRAQQLYAFLREKGFSSGDRVGIATTNDLESCVLVLSLLRLGMPVALIDAGAKKTEATQIIGRLQLKALFLDPALSEDWRPEGPALFVVKQQKNKLIFRLLGKKDKTVSVPENDYPDCLQSYSASVSTLPTLTDISSPALLLCTSGTTGLPKILQLSLTNLIAAAKTTSTKLGFDEETSVLNLLPLTHYDGVVSGLFTAFCTSARQIRLEPFTVALLPEILDAIYKYRSTHVLLTPAILALLLRLGEDIGRSFQTEDFRFVISVAATLPPKVWSQFERATTRRIVNMYGLSETGNNLFAGPDDDSYRIGSIGKPVDCRALIVREDGTRANPVETGELFLEGASITSGYLGETITTSQVDGIDWFATGDLAYCDEEGIYWLVGRRKNIVIVGGRNVYPDEVNNVLLSHPAVTEAAIVGIPDDVWGERIAACVVCRQPVTSSELIEYAAKSLSDYKVPRELHIFNDLPKTRSGKIILQELVRRIQNARTDGADHDGMQVEEQVIRLAAESFRTPAAELSLKSTTATCSRWDSVAHMDFVTNLESKFGIELLPREVIQITSLDAALRIVRAKLNSR